MKRKYCHYCSHCKREKLFWTLRARLAYGLAHLTAHPRP